MAGFLTPCHISESLSRFCNVKYGTKLCRIDVTKKICNYIKNNNLQNPEDKREILPDDKLTKVLNYNKDTDNKLTYYCIQKLLQPHFGPNGSKFKKDQKRKIKMDMFLRKAIHERKFRYVLFDIARRIHRKDYRITMNDLKYTPLFGAGYYIIESSYYTKEKLNIA